MAKAEIAGRRGNYVAAYRHYGSRQPADLGQALTEVSEALREVTAAQGSRGERCALEDLATQILGLRERLDAATIDVVVRLREQDRSVTYLSQLLSTARPTIQGWFAKLDGSS